MNLIFSQHQNLKIIGMFFFVMLILSNSVTAGNSWWNKGEELLKSIGNGGKASGLTVDDIAAGLKEALLVGSENVVTNLGRTDGFNKDSAIHIPLPEQFDQVKTVLDNVGMAGMLDDLELKLNRAAEVATTKAKEIFRQAITEMSFDDVKAIFDGPEDAATQYFRNKMSPSLAKEMQPVVDSSLLEVGAVKAYDDTMKTYQALPFVPDVKSDLSSYVVEKGIDGIFYYMAKEEAAIRSDPAKRTTEILKQVFGQ